MLNIYKKLKIRFLQPRERADFLRKNDLVKMGENCEIFNDVSFGSEPYLVQLGNQVKITAGVRFVTHDGGMWVIRNLGWNENADKMDKIIVGDNVFIGINAIIMPGVTIGSNVIIGGGSVVSKNVPDNTIVAGVPAREICTIEEFYNKNQHRIYDTKQMSYDEKKKFYLSKVMLDN